MAKYLTYRIRKPDGEYHLETVNVESQVPYDVHLSNVEGVIFRQYRELGNTTPMGRWELIKD